MLPRLVTSPPAVRLPLPQTLLSSLLRFALTERPQLYITVLRDPTARYLSQYLHMADYGRRFLNVRTHTAYKKCVHLSPRHLRHVAPATQYVGVSMPRVDVVCVCAFAHSQGTYEKWPAEMRSMGWRPEDGIPSLKDVLTGTQQPSACTHSAHSGSNANCIVPERQLLHCPQEGGPVASLAGSKTTSWRVRVDHIPS